MTGPRAPQARPEPRRGTLTPAGFLSCGLCGKGASVYRMGSRALSGWRGSSRHGVVHVRCLRSLRNRQRPATRDTRGRYAVRGAVDLHARSAPESKLRSQTLVPYGRGRPLAPSPARARATLSGLEGRKVLHAGTPGRILEVRGHRALVQPEPVTTRTRSVLYRGRWGRSETITGERTEWGPDIWVDLRRLAPA